MFKNIGNGIKVGGFKSRLFLYFIIYVLYSFLILGLTEFKFNNGIVLWIFVLLLLSSPIIFWERSIRNWRRKNNLSVYGNIEEALIQMDVNQKVAREHQAFKDVGIIKNEKEKDLNYYFELKEKGAISAEEYEAKKKELL
ncbi:MAG: SHOCT domain-containing protein [Sulfurimonas sp.]|nr:SHOCT domain-containing protein [Sulfurimonas sp.]